MIMVNSLSQSVQNPKGKCCDNGYFSKSFGINVAYLLAVTLNDA